MSLQQKRGQGSSLQRVGVTASMLEVWPGVAWSPPTGEAAVGGDKGPRFSLECS